MTAILEFSSQLFIVLSGLLLLLATGLFLLLTLRLIFAAWDRWLRQRLDLPPTKDPDDYDGEDW